MPELIRHLPDHVANQITAAEGFWARPWPLSRPFRNRFADYKVKVIDMLNRVTPLWVQ